MTSSGYVYFVDNGTQKEVLDAASCIQAIEDGYRAWANGDAAINPKTELHVYGRDGYYDLGLIHGAIAPLGVAALRIKSDFHRRTGDTSYGDKHAGFEGQFCGLVLLFDTNNGLPLAVLNDGHIQHMRVAAAAAVAAKYLAREDATSLCILGSGGMAYTHALAIAEVRPIRKISVYSPNPQHRHSFAHEIATTLGVEVSVNDTPEEAIRGATIVACCTNSNRQAVLHGEWLEPGMHITTVLGAELGAGAAEMVGRSVKNQPIRDISAHFAVAGIVPEGLVPRPQGWHPPAVTEDMPLLTDLLLGNVPGRVASDEITYFSNNEGTGIQFAAAGASIMRSLAARNFEGVAKVPLALFVEDMRD